MGKKILFPLKVWGKREMIELHFSNQMLELVYYQYFWDMIWNVGWTNWEWEKVKIITDLVQVLQFRLHIIPGGGGGDGGEQGIGRGAQEARAIPATTSHNLY